MTTSSALKALTAAVSLLVPVLQAEAERPPNFVLILADDQGYGDLSCYGSTEIATPRLDRMAAEGMRFTSFYAQPLCGASRAALMTGCYPMRVAELGNVKAMHPVLHRKEVTLAEVLKGRGYTTALVGKWDLAGHSSTDFRTNLMPLGQGFDSFLGTPASNDSWERVPLLRDGTLVAERFPQEVSSTRLYTDEALRFLEAHREGPFFLYLSFNMPHTELHLSPGYEGKSGAGLYGDVVQELDHEVGRVLDALVELELAASTYVLYTSDNGPWLNRPAGRFGSAGPFRGGKASTWEGGLRVPCIWWAPGRVPAGTSCDELASTLDILPTLSALAGADVPADRVIDGEDVRHLLSGDFDQANGDKVFLYYLKTHLQAVRQGRFKLHLARPEHPEWLDGLAHNVHIAPEDDVGFPEPALFDLVADPGETLDVASEHPEIVARLLAAAESAREDIGDWDRVGENMRFFGSGERPTVPKRVR